MSAERHWSELSRRLRGMPMPAALGDAESAWDIVFLAPLSAQNRLCSWMGQPAAASEKALQRLFFSIYRKEKIPPEEWAALGSSARDLIVGSLASQLQASLRDDRLVAYAPLPAAGRWLVAFRAQDFPDGRCLARPGVDPFDPAPLPGDDDQVDLLWQAGGGRSWLRAPRSHALFLNAEFEEIPRSERAERSRLRRLERSPVEEFVEWLEIDALCAQGPFAARAKAA